MGRILWINFRVTFSAQCPQSFFTFLSSKCEKLCVPCSLCCDSGFGSGPLALLIEYYVGSIGHTQVKRSHLRAIGSRMGRWAPTKAITTAPFLSNGFCISRQGFSGIRRPATERETHKSRSLVIILHLGGGEII